MSDKKKSGNKKPQKTVVYDSLVQGALDGLTGDALFNHVKTVLPEVKNKAVIKAGISALQDPKLTDRIVLDSLYDLAIQRRLAGIATVSETKSSQDVEANTSDATTTEKKRRKKAA
ncbi:hypothetical protein [Asticcacaulis benevestitus]|uniref:Uncharacterized protein n=1 Tax=Asticcacaulis benevestitus DSM 16100 = ATCC BAA-896 TaxID=1121022 RepID=V4PQL6_9CAUL|nr:hypothetical protein [Asticcacaulis benevestitus]ESQ87815.1 hypothetical protein ABENE_16820 [Asticcacaulis benevestitus DSM 16100 = ATCC BAA-896]